MNFQTLRPLFTRNVIGMDAGGYGALYGAMGIGALVGSLHTPRMEVEAASGLTAQAATRDRPRAT